MFRQQYLVGKYWYSVYFVYILNTKKKQCQHKQKKTKKMKKIVVMIALVVSVVFSVSAQYSLSVNYGNMDWIPKSNKVLAYENVFMLQSYSFNGISVWQASCIAKSSNSYELGGIDYKAKLGKFVARVAMHGYFPKEDLFHYTSSGNVIPNVGVNYALDSTQSITVNVYQFWNYGISDQFIISNAVYRKSLKFGSLELGQYYNFKTMALSGSIAYTKSWPILGKLSGFASLRCSWNESRTKLNDGIAFIANIGVSF